MTSSSSSLAEKGEQVPVMHDTIVVPLIQRMIFSNVESTMAGLKLSMSVDCFTQDWNSEG